MQIDFHHAVTYIVARDAGFSHGEANIIAYCAQYVDDATNDGIIKFDNGAMYNRIYSAHQQLDYRHFVELSNHQVWIPFHFLPGNAGVSADEKIEGSFINKIICRPGGPVAEDMIRACILDNGRPYSLHRLGIVMHVLADTYSHQGFAGVMNPVNRIRNIRAETELAGYDLTSNLKNCFGDNFDERTSGFVSTVLPLGHGAALTYPDQPSLKWSYVRHDGETIERDNRYIFIDAANHMAKVMRKYRAKTPDATEVSGLSSRVREKLKIIFENAIDPVGENRHKHLLREIEHGRFEFEGVKLVYNPKGVGSWKCEALGTNKSTDEERDVFQYRPDFLTSNWKMFHDALQAHRFSVICDILPKYGICAA